MQINNKIWRKKLVTDIWGMCVCVCDSQDQQAHDSNKKKKMKNFVECPLDLVNMRIITQVM